MNQRNWLDLDLGDRVKSYLEQNWDELIALMGTSAPALQLLKTKLDAAVDTVRRVRGGQVLWERKTVVRTRKGLRRVLHRYYLRAVHRVSELIAESNPNATIGVNPVIDMPPENSSENVLLAAADAAVALAEGNRSLFEQHGMPTELPDKIREITNSIRGAKNSKNGLSDVRVQATATIHGSLRRVKFVIRCITPLLRPALDRAGERRVALTSGWDSSSSRQRDVVFQEPSTPVVTPTQAV